MDLACRVLGPSCHRVSNLLSITSSQSKTFFVCYSLRPKISAVLHYSCSTFDRPSYLKFFYD
jgi:hypothetical protein